MCFDISLLSAAKLPKQNLPCDKNMIARERNTPSEEKQNTAYNGNAGEKQDA